MQSFFDIDSLRLWWNVERKGELTEIRLIDSHGTIYSGYYKEFDNIVRDISAHPDCNVYATINHLREDVYSRVQHEVLVKKPKITTSDRDVVGRTMVVIDIDPKRSAGVNSTEEELNHAKQTANRVYKYLVDQGFSRPIVSLSGNGVHLRFRTRIKADEESTKMIRDFLMVIDSMFSDENAEIDTSVFNLARVLKCVGCPSRKGADTPERPQRLSSYVMVPDDWQVTEREYFEKIAALKASPEEPSRDNNYRVDSRFDVREFIQRHNIQVEKEVKTSTGTRFILKHCVFCDQHVAPDAMIFQSNDGALGYSCFHQSCSMNHWKEVRMLFEPESYTRTAQAEFRQRREYYSPRKPFVPMPETKELGKKWMTAADIQYDPKPAPSIPTGYYDLDKKTGGMLLGDVSLISGKPGSGKSIWLDSIILNVITRGYKVGVWSGELQPNRFMGWLAQVAAGKSYVQKVEGYDNFYRTPPMVAEKIFNWLDGKLWLYSSEKYSNSWAQLLTDMEGVLKLHPVQLFVVDNLSALDLDDYDGTQYEKQKKFVVDLKKFAKEKNVHIALVAHPRKTTQVLRREDISGDANLCNLVDCVLLVHRVGRDFEAHAGEFFRKEDVQNMLQYDTVIELAKNRVNGVVDYLMGLYYEPESKRLKSQQAENYQYPWNTSEGVRMLPPDPDPYELTTTNEEPPF